mmetsp:Transcript_26478/g.23423  ORF Transcript_26478/g.23423 Transcript_26478/m.23423 type:complete len:107 (-) Transcript_26478:18-338(-)
MLNELKEIHLEFANIRSKIKIEVKQEKPEHRTTTNFTLYSRCHKGLKTVDTRSSSRLFSLSTQEEFEKIKDDYPLLITEYVELNSSFDDYGEIDGDDFKSHFMVHR